jgi:hypothetical protein
MQKVAGKHVDAVGTSRLQVPATITLSKNSKRRQSDEWEDILA